ncbi:hypothetical protein [Phytoactinopolyspora mesophila]|uniref:Helix-turn-helix domain containing protein n=1 Tax=Phytoactinopolyspora mesophila TaxID=2650750 RepID=A0A7K3M5N0_9ACTN|nr:hypothetical protein [Phytoactinopolyspora mesophila]NDL58629.1 hypothetical protein [Phytoactinopolyspora mesophila]
MSRRVEIDIDRAIELYQSGLTLKEVGEQLGVSGSLIRLRFKELGVDRRTFSECAKLRFETKPGSHGRILRHLDTDEIVRRYQEGESVDDIAESCQVSCTPIRDRLISAGVQMRGPGELVAQLPVETIIAQYEAGASIYALARQYATGWNTIKNVLDEQGCPPQRGQRLIPVPVPEWSRAEVAERMRIRQDRRRRTPARRRRYERRVARNAAERAVAQAQRQAITTAAATAALSLDERYERRRQGRDASAYREVATAGVVRVLLDAGFDVRRGTTVGDYVTMCTVDNLAIELHYGLRPDIRVRNGLDQRAKVFTKAGFGFLVVLAVQRLLLPDNDLDLIRAVEEYRNSGPVPGGFLLLRGEGNAPGRTPIEQRFCLVPIKW